MVDINSIYINKKHNKEYFVQAIGTNCTNSHDGELMVRYIPIPNEGGHEFYREIEEFDKKFRKKRFKDV